MLMKFRWIYTYIEFSSQSTYTIVKVISECVSLYLHNEIIYLSLSARVYRVDRRVRCSLSNSPGSPAQTPRRMHASRARAVGSIASQKLFYRSGIKRDTLIRRPVRETGTPETASRTGIPLISCLSTSSHYRYSSF